MQEQVVLPAYFAFAQQYPPPPPLFKRVLTTCKIGDNSEEIFQSNVYV